MKKYLFLIACLLNSILASAQFSGSGNGTESDPYLIYNENQLAQMGNFLNQSGVVFKLMKDLDITNYIAENNPTGGWQPIGVEETPFKGVLYGNNHSVSGLFINQTTDNVGFFGYVDGATIKGLTLNGSSVKGNLNTGTLCGTMGNSTIENCSCNITDVVTGTGKLGGLFGKISDSSVKNCIFNGNINSGEDVGGIAGDGSGVTFDIIYVTSNTINGTYNVGGVIGLSKNNSIKNAKVTANVNGNTKVSGIIARSSGLVSLQKIEHTGDISGKKLIGGIIGLMCEGSTVTITNTSSKGIISNTGDYSGGIVASSSGACVIKMDNCSHFGDISGQNYVGGLVGKIEKIDRQPTLHRYTWSGSSSSEYADITDASNVYVYKSITESILSTGTIKTNNINNCTSIGNIAGKNYVAGLIGEDLSSYSYTESQGTFSPSILFPAYSSLYWYLWKDGVYAVTKTKNGNCKYSNYIRSYTVLNVENSSYSGIISGTDYIGGLFGHKEEGCILNCYANCSSIKGSKYVGGLVGCIEGESSTSQITLKSNVAITSNISASTSYAGRIYGYKSNDYVTIGTLGTSESNRALTQASVGISGVVQTIAEDIQNGNNVGPSMLKLKANYVSWGWDFNNDWRILETESFPYKMYQAAPPTLDKNPVSQDTEIKGKSVDGGTVYMIYKNTPNGSVSTSTKAWTFKTAALQSGAECQFYADVEGLTPSYLTSAIVGYPGSGTEADPYRIYTAEDLQGATKAGYYKVMNDIDLTSWIEENSPTTGWVAIGRNGTEATYIDGDNHTISGLWINSTDTYQGLFSNYSAGYIKNLNVEVANGKTVKGGDRTAALIGCMTNGEINNCNVIGNVSGTTSVGGIVGYLDSSTISNCHYEGKVTNSAENAAIGGVAGYVNAVKSEKNSSVAIITSTQKGNWVGGLFGKVVKSSGYIRNSFAYASINTSGASDMVGGLVGYSDSPISNSYSSVNIVSSGNSCYAGGLAGNMNNSVIRCYSIGNVTVTGDDSYTGGLIGNATSLVQNSYSTVITSGTYYTAGLVAYTTKGVDKCYASGNVSGVRYGAGLVGKLDGASAYVTNSIAANNKIDLTDQASWGCRVIGGFANGCPEPTLGSNFALSTMQVSLNGVAQKKTDDNIEGVAKTETELLTKSTYTGLSWDMSSIWVLSKDKGYPYLLNCNPVVNSGVEMVDLGLPSGTLWANMNVGASSPKEAGCYYAWGETQIKETYNWSTYKWCEGTSTTLTKYNSDSSSGSVDNKSVLDSEDDAAYVNWGADWKMPTSAQLSELISNCQFVSTTLYGQEGYTVTGKNGNSIFLPKTHYMSGSKLGTYSDDYWANEVSPVVNAACMNIKTNPVVTKNQRYYGFTIRPVAKTPKSIVTISKSELELKIGKTSNLSATSNIEGDVIVWSTSDANIASVSNGTVTAKSIGTVNIIATSSKDNTVSAICTVTVIPAFIRGDVTGEGDITSADVTGCLKFVLGDDTEGLNEEAADYNGNGVVTVTDAISIVRLALTGKTSIDAKSRRSVLNTLHEEPVLTIDDITLDRGGSVECPIDFVSADKDFVSFQFDVYLPDGMSIEGINAGSKALDHTLTYLEREEGFVRVICYSLSNSTFSKEEGNAISLILKANDEIQTGLQDITFAGVELVCPDLSTEKTTVQKISVNVQDVTDIASLDAEGLIDVYDIQGRRLYSGTCAGMRNRISKGVYIINGKKYILK